MRETQDAGNEKANSLTMTRQERKQHNLEILRMYDLKPKSPQEIECEQAIAKFFDALRREKTEDDYLAINSRVLQARLKQGKEDDH